MRDASLHEFDWISHGCLREGFTLAHFVPACYSELIQIRHPVTVPHAVATARSWPLLPGRTRDGDVRVPWTAVVADGLPSADTVLRAINPMPEAELSIAWLGACEVTTLVDQLGPAELFLYWDEVCSGQARVDTCQQGSTEDWTRFADAHEADDHTWSPTYLWPTDRRWLLWTSYDLYYSVFACSDPARVQTLCADPRIEAVRIPRNTVSAGSL